MKTQLYLDLDCTILGNKDVPADCFETMAALEDKDVLSLLAGVDLIRNHYFKNRIHLCTICNGKSGKCSEDCSFCSQSKFHTSDIDIYPLHSEEN